MKIICNEISFQLTSQGHLTAAAEEDEELGFVYSGCALLSWPDKWMRCHMHAALAFSSENVCAWSASVPFRLGRYMKEECYWQKKSQTLIVSNGWPHKTAVMPYTPIPNKYQYDLESSFTYSWMSCLHVCRVFTSRNPSICPLFHVRCSQGYYLINFLMGGQPPSW